MFVVKAKEQSSCSEAWVTQPMMPAQKNVVCTVFWMRVDPEFRQAQFASLAHVSGDGVRWQTEAACEVIDVHGIDA